MALQTQGRTGEIIDTVEEDGRHWFVKRNSSSQITEIELRIYRALFEDSVLSDRGVSIPRVKRGNDPQLLLVENCGQTLEHFLHLSEEADAKKARFEELLERLVPMRSRVNDILNTMLTCTDKDFLQALQLEKTFGAARRIDPREATITHQDVETHFWAYRAMNALGIFDEKFKNAYSRLIGEKIQKYLPKYGQWISDNCIRNNTSSNGIDVTPIDFNNITYGLRQMDEAAVTSLCLFPGPAEIFVSKEEREEYIAQLQVRHRPSEYDADYLPAFLLSAVHQHVRFAGYRTREMRAWKNELDRQWSVQKKVERQTAHAFRKAFDEIEYHHTPAIQILQQYPSLFTSSSSDQRNEQDLYCIEQKIHEATFTQRVLNLFSDWHSSVFWSIF